MAWNGRSSRDEKSIVPVIRNIQPLEPELPYERKPQQDPREAELLRQLEMRLQEPENDLNRDPLDVIAEDVLSLTFGEMIKLAEELWKAANSDKITAESLPMVLHIWADKKKSKPEKGGESDQTEKEQI